MKSDIKKIILAVLGTVSLLVSFSALAQDETASERARLRQYPGGKEEESLEVQAALPVPVRKVYRQQIEKRELGKNKKRGPQNNEVSESALGAPAPAATEQPKVDESPEVEKE